MFFRRGECYKSRRSRLFCSWEREGNVDAVENYMLAQKNLFPS